MTRLGRTISVKVIKIIIKPSVPYLLSKTISLQNTDRYVI